MAETKTQPDKFSELAREFERDILDTLKASLPYFESDDRDDFIYLARIQDVKNAAGNIAALLRNRLGEGWISVSERLPELGHTVLIYDPAARVIDSAWRVCGERDKWNWYLERSDASGRGNHLRPGADHVLVRIACSTCC